ncbi:MAG: D-alanyl-D-alanine dipeptidase [Myxococcota bacterium]|nr:D-alanyl-D-alanine dipeptidase [Myxococcota bacterium]
MEPSAATAVRRDSPPVISDPADPRVRLVDAGAAIPHARLDVRYATANNFTGKTLYPIARCLLRKEAVEKLKLAAQRLYKQGIGVVLHDCYRPHSIQWKLWDVIPKEGYVANPRKGSVHNRGCAVDLSLYDLSTGKTLEMPSEYDEFNRKAWHSWKNAPALQLRNREVLRAAMTQAGFRANPMEWWHYELPRAGRYPLLDVPLDARVAE